MTSMPTFSIGPGTAVWLDAAGTVLHPAASVASVYAAFARARGYAVTATVLKPRLYEAMAMHRGLRAGDPSWRAYWRAVVRDAVGAQDEALLDALYDHYAQPSAWTIAPGAVDFITAAREAGSKVAMISNWDTRLRPMLASMGLLEAFDTVVVSGEEGVEKPAAVIFERTAGRLAVPPDHSLMVGDDPVSDVQGARSIGAFVIRFGSDVMGFGELHELCSQR
ncbi:MAG: HAD-IA family hydrolase [Myxococcota bacterium]